MDGRVRELMQLTGTQHWRNKEKYTPPPSPLPPPPSRPAVLPSPPPSPFLPDHHLSFPGHHKKNRTRNLLLLWMLLLVWPGCRRLVTYNGRLPIVSVAPTICNGVEPLGKAGTIYKELSMSALRGKASLIGET